MYGFVKEQILQTTGLKIIQAKRKMKKNNIIYLNGLIDLAQSRLGSKIVYKTDEFFAPAKRIINPWPPVFKEGVFDKHGKWMDGWETRRKENV